MKKPTLFLYCSGIDEVLSGSTKVAGIQVQMSFWAATFVEHGWDVYSFSDKKKHSINGICFLLQKISWLDRHGLSIIKVPIEAYRVLRKTKADVVFVRGGQRNLYAIRRVCGLLNAKLVFLGASDRDFEPGKELILGANINLKLYRKALQETQYIITQNQFQSDSLYKYYCKKSIIIPNIWPMADIVQCKEKKYVAVWVANLRRLKRAEWFLDLVEHLPQYQFAIVGGASERDYYDKIETQASSISNLDFLGPQSLNAVNAILSNSKLLVCTSEFEGFPNTFLQAWSQFVPVISTVNPSGAITEYGLGKVIENENELLIATEELLTSAGLYEQCQENIKTYFLAHHNADIAYQRIMELIEFK